MIDHTTIEKFELISDSDEVLGQALALVMGARRAALAFKLEGNELIVLRDVTTDATRFPTGLRHEQLTPIVSAWLADRSNWEGVHCPDTDGSVGRGFHIRASENSGYVIFRVRPHYTVYGK